MLLESSTSSIFIHELEMIPTLTGIYLMLTPFFLCVTQTLSAPKGKRASRDTHSFCSDFTAYCERQTYKVNIAAQVEIAILNIPYAREQNKENHGMEGQLGGVRKSYSML